MCVVMAEHICADEQNRDPEGTYERRKRGEGYLPYGPFLSPPRSPSVSAVLLILSLISSPPVVNSRGFNDYIWRRLLPPSSAPPDYAKQAYILHL